MENTVIQHKFLKFDQNQTNPRFSINTPRTPDETGKPQI